MWHAGNFAPEAKMDKTGGTFSGTVTIPTTPCACPAGAVPRPMVSSTSARVTVISSSPDPRSLPQSGRGVHRYAQCRRNCLDQRQFDPSKKLSITGGDLTGPLRMRGNAAGRISLYDDNLDVANLEIGAGLNTGTDRNGFWSTECERLACTAWRQRKSQGNRGWRRRVHRACLPTARDRIVEQPDRPALRYSTRRQCRRHEGNAATDRKWCNGWSSARWRLYREVDATTQGYIDFHGDSTDGDRVFTFAGYGQSFWLRRQVSWKLPRGSTALRRASSSRTIR